MGVVVVVVVVVEVVVEVTPMGNSCASISPRYVCLLVDVQAPRDIAELLDNLLVCVCVCVCVCMCGHAHE